MDLYCFLFYHHLFHNKHEMHVPIAEPASDGAGGIQTFLKLDLVKIFPLAEFHCTHPPLKHKLFDERNANNLSTNLKNKNSYSCCKVA